MADFDDLFEPNAIEGRASLVDFVDMQAVRIARDCVGDYTRARLPGGDAWLMTDGGLRSGMETATWEAFPAVLTMLGEVIEGALAPLAYDRLVQLQGVIGVAAEAFDRHEIPPPSDPAAWAASRDGMVRFLAALGGRPPRPPAAIVEGFAGTVLAVMPFHLDLGPDDYPLLCDLLNAKLAAARGEFEREANWPAVAKALSAPRQTAA